MMYDFSRKDLSVIDNKRTLAIYGIIESLPLGALILGPVKSADIEGIRTVGELVKSNLMKTNDRLRHLITDIGNAIEYSSVLYLEFRMPAFEDRKIRSQLLDNLYGDLGRYIKPNFRPGIVGRIKAAVDAAIVEATISINAGREQAQSEGRGEVNVPAESVNIATGNAA